MENLENVNVEEQEELVEDKFDLDKLKGNEEFNKYLQSYADSRVTSALQKKDKETKQLLEEEKRRSELTAEELQQEKMRELQEREEKLKQYELRLKKIDFFKENGMNIDLVDFVHVNDEEELAERSEQLLAIVNEMVESKVKERLKENGYTPSNSEPKTELGIEDLKGLSPEEINKLW